MWYLNSLIAPYGTHTCANDVHITGLAIDSRLVEPGDLFIALPGIRTDGSHFISDAISRGARAVLVPRLLSEYSDVPVVAIPSLRTVIGHIASRFFDHPSQRLHVTGVTGTNGKTSVSYFAAQLLAAVGQDAGLIGTLGRGVWHDLQPGTHTTPDAIALQRNLTELYQQGLSHVILEVSSHALDQHRVDGIDFNVALWTNLTPEHQDYHASMQDYAAAKARLFSDFSPQVAIIHEALPESLIASIPSDLPCIRYGLSSQADVRLQHLQPSNHGHRGALYTPWGQADVMLPFLEPFNLSNVLAAVSILGCCGFELSEIAPFLSQITSPPGRMQWVHGQPAVCVDYAHTPDALEQLLRVAKAHCQGQLWCVFGCGGDRDRHKRASMGQAASRWADHIVLTNDNPRSESPEAIVNDICQGVAEPSRIRIVFDRKHAIMKTILAAGDDDTVVIAGKGHEKKQFFSDHVASFSDIDVAQQARQVRLQRGKAGT